jgi:hypothetical protein
VFLHLAIHQLSRMEFRRECCFHLFHPNKAKLHPRNPVYFVKLVPA